MPRGGVVTDSRPSPRPAACDDHTQPSGDPLDGIEGRWTLADPALSQRARTPFLGPEGRNSAKLPKYTDRPASRSGTRWAHQAAPSAATACQPGLHAGQAGRWLETDPGCARELASRNAQHAIPAQWTVRQKQVGKTPRHRGHSRPVFRYDWKRPAISLVPHRILEPRNLPFVQVALAATGRTADLPFRLEMKNG